MAGKVTLYDIADELGISASTVSRVLNNTGLIGEEKSQIIRETARRLGYEPRRVKKQSTRVILNIQLFLPPARESFIHLFYDIATILEGIKEGFGTVSVNILTRINDGDMSFFQKKKTGRIDGCIFAFTRAKPRLKKLLEERKIPFIHLNRQEEPSYVCFDNRKGMGRLVEILFGRYGPRLTPCYIGFSPLEEVSRERFEGIRDACRRLSVDFDLKDSYNLNNIDELDGVMDRLKGKNYNTILCFNDLVAISLYQRIKAITHESVPLPFSLTGMDNSPIQDIVGDNIDTIEFSEYQLAFEAARWLYRYIIEKKETPCRLIYSGKYKKGNTI